MKAFLAGILIAVVLCGATLMLYPMVAVESAGGYTPGAHLHLD